MSLVKVPPISVKPCWTPPLSKASVTTPFVLVSRATRAARTGCGNSWNMSIRHNGIALVAEQLLPCHLSQPWGPGVDRNGIQRLTSLSVLPEK
jgi:hypothetical protein